jgi:TRAP transporter 4TM/12TM fusion protein
MIKNKNTFLYISYFISLILGATQLLFVTTRLIELKALLAAHVFLILALAFLISSDKYKERKSVFHLFIIFSVFSIVILGWYLKNLEFIITRLPFVTRLSHIELIMGILAISLIIIGSWFYVGWPMTLLVLFFLAYALFLGPYLPGLLKTRAVSIEEFIDYTFLGDGGIFGSPVYVSAVYVYLFVVMGVFLGYCGAQKIFNDVALVVTWRSYGGAAKASVIAGALIGTITGSAVAATVAVGSFIAPLIIDSGFDKVKAGALLACVGTGSQLMPPIMGAAAFLMAYLLGISYWRVAIHAALPAILYYALIFIQTDLEARRRGIRELMTAIPKWRSVVESLYLLLPLAVIFSAIALFYDVAYAGYLSFITSLFTWTLRDFMIQNIFKWIISSIYLVLIILAMHLRIDIALVTAMVVFCILILILFKSKINPNGVTINISSILEGFYKASKDMISVAVACAAAGIIIGSLTITGLNLKLSTLLMQWSGGNLTLLLLLTMGVAYVLGMGMPTSAVYVTVAATLTPALIMAGLHPVVAHLFSFYAAMLSMITPPVALASFAAAGIVKENPFKVGLEAMKFRLMLLVLPFIFAYKPALLAIGTPLEIMATFIIILISFFPLSIAFIGYSNRALGYVERLLYLLSAALILIPEVYTSIVGLAIFLLLLMYDKRLSKKR